MLNIFTIKAQQDTISTKKTLKPIIVSSALVLTGLILINDNFKKQQLDFRSYNFPNFQTKIDDYLQFFPHALYMSGSLINLKTKHSFKDRAGIMAMGSIIVMSATTLLKNTTNIMRPDGSKNNSFPSGHTAKVFFGAALLDLEYDECKDWYNYCNYGIAASVGILRVANNKHWVSDVLVGAGLGILSAKCAYWLYPKAKSLLFGRNTNLSLMPLYNGNNLCLQANYNF
ncbi:MAG: phosphatase PAP2 family protein [Pseudarcicella sp.]|nr:phosphatase PAP2 family protein [Pseudarcicella sp.]